MKQVEILILFLVLFGLNWKVSGQTFDIYKSDTINRTSVDGKKTGHWIVFFENSNQVIEKEGYFSDNRKTGIWKEYYLNGNPKSEITYVDDFADGYARLFYENGKICEEGNWKGTKWVGKYLYYYENGNKQYEWSFNDGGKREGEQKYYHENGKLRIRGEWADGKENGIISEYDASGNLKSEKAFASGSIDEKTSKFYAVKKISVDEIPDITNATSGKDTTDNITSKNSFDTFTGTGKFRLYNAYNKLDREGEFNEGKLINGKKYYYTSDGKLIKTEIYTNGKVSDVIR